MSGCLMIVCMSLKTNSKGLFIPSTLLFSLLGLCSCLFICSGICLELDTTSLLDPLENSGSEEDMTLVKIQSHECKCDSCFVKVSVLFRPNKFVCVFYSIALL
jgi:hypothetical protein